MNFTRTVIVGQSGLYSMCVDFSVVCVQVLQRNAWSDCSLRCDEWREFCERQEVVAGDRSELRHRQQNSR